MPFQSSRVGGRWAGDEDPATSLPFVRVLDWRDSATGTARPPRSHQSSAATDLSVLVHRRPDAHVSLCLAVACGSGGVGRVPGRSRLGSGPVLAPQFRSGLRWSSLEARGCAALAGYCRGRLGFLGASREHSAQEPVCQVVSHSDDVKSGTFNRTLKHSCPHTVWKPKPQVKRSNVCSSAPVSTGLSTVLHTASRRVPRVLHRVVHRGSCWG